MFRGAQNFWGTLTQPGPDVSGMRPQSGEYFAPNPILFFFSTYFAHKFGGEDQRWNPRERRLPRGYIFKSLALASKPQVLENCPVLGSRTALFFEWLKFCRSAEKCFSRPFFFLEINRVPMSMSPLNNFSDFFVEKIAIFVTLKKITHLNFQNNLKRKYRKCQVRKTLVFSKFSNSNFKPTFSLHFSAFCLSHILCLPMSEREGFGRQKTLC